MVRLNERFQILFDCIYLVGYIGLAAACVFSLPLIILLCAVAMGVK